MSGADGAPAMRRVVACGLATLDVVQYVAHVPAPDEKVVADGLVVAAGGPALNAVLTARALGVAATLVAHVGHGPVADLVRAELAAGDVALVDVAGPTGAPPVSSVLVTTSTGERAVVSVNAAGVVERPEIDVDVLAGADALLVDGHLMAAAVALGSAARERGVCVLLDAGSWKPGTEALLAHVDVAALSADFTLDGALVGDLAQVAALGPSWVIRTHGAGAVELHDARAGTTTTRLVAPATVVDTLGAGDVFHGALLAALAGLGPRPHARAMARAVDSAVRVAGWSVRYAGARGWVGGPEHRAATAR